MVFPNLYGALARGTVIKSLATGPSADGTFAGDRRSRRRIRSPQTKYGAMSADTSTMVARLAIWKKPRSAPPPRDLTGQREMSGSVDRVRIKSLNAAPAS